MSTNRTRDRSIADQYGNYVEDHWPSGTTYTYPGLILRHEESMSDVVTENFREAIANGAVINNPCSYVKNTITTSGYGAGSHQNASATQGWTSYGYPTAALKPSNPDSVWPQIAWVEPSVKDLARLKLEAIARIDSSQYSFGEDTAELKETLQFLRHPVDSLLGLTRQHQKLLRKAQRKHWRAKRRPPPFEPKLSVASRMKQLWLDYKGDARNLAKAYADVWSSYSFAAAPTYRSMNDAIEAYITLPERIQSTSNRETAHARSEDVWSDSWTSLNHQVNSSVSRLYAISRRWTKSAHVSILYEVRNPVKDMKQGLGLRPKDFPVTMWQIMPLSFMVDRIYDVSSLLKATINIGDPKVKILCGAVTQKSEQYSTIQLTNVNATYWPGNTVGEVVEDKQFSYNRLPWAPSLNDAIPSFDAKPLIEDATKIADALAVVTKLLL